MSEYVETATLGEAQAIIAKIDSLLGYPNEKTKTLTYANPLLHDLDKSKQGAKRYLVIVKDGVGYPKLARNAVLADLNGRLTAKELGQKKTRQTLEQEKAFKVIKGFVRL